MNDSEPRITDELEPYERQGGVLACPGCGELFAIRADWLDAHAGEHIGCPGCGHSRAIPIET